jgi:lipopolysaccharide export system ATP-binding protein
MTESNLPHDDPSGHAPETSRAPDALPAAARTLLEQLDRGDPSHATVLRAVIEASTFAPDGAAPLHEVARHYRAQRLAAVAAEGRDVATAESRLGDEDIRYHLSHSAFPMLAAEGFIELPASGVIGPEDHVRLAPALRDALAADRAGVLARLRETGEHAVARHETPTTLPAIGGSELAAEGLVKVYRGRKVVNDVAVRLRQGEIVGLLGPNGAGKTTTFYMIVGLIAPLAGRITLDGEDITRTPMYQRAQRGIGYLAQEPSIFRKLTVEDNILAILETLDLTAKERAQRLETLLDELKIKHLRRSKAFQLSGGERRRLEITRALVTEPRFMMLDEPFAGVDPIAVDDIQKIVAQLRYRGIGVLISDHNVEQTLDIVDRAYIMYDGQVKYAGTVRDLVFDDTVSRIYLGPTLTARLRARFAETAAEATV